MPVICTFTGFCLIYDVMTYFRRGGKFDLLTAFLMKIEPLGIYDCLLVIFDIVSEMFAASFFRVVMPNNIAYFNSTDEQLYECD